MHGRRGWPGQARPRRLKSCRHWHHSRSSKDAVAAFIDDLLALGNREGDRLLPVLVGFGPNEPVFFHPLRAVLLDNTRGLILSIGSVRRRTDAITSVFDRRCGRLAGCALASPVEEAAQCGFEFREHRPASSLLMQRYCIIARSAAPLLPGCAWSRMRAVSPSLRADAAG